MSKILVKVIDDCVNCSFKRLNKSFCSLSGKPIDNPWEIPSWCELEDKK